MAPGLLGVLLKALMIRSGFPGLEVADGDVAEFLSFDRRDEDGYSVWAGAGRGLGSAVPDGFAGAAAVAELDRVLGPVAAVLGFERTAVAVALAERAFDLGVGGVEAASAWLMVPCRIALCRTPGAGRG